MYSKQVHVSVFWQTSIKSADLFGNGLAPRSRGNLVRMWAPYINIVVNLRRLFWADLLYRLDSIIWQFQQSTGQLCEIDSDSYNNRLENYVWYIPRYDSFNNRLVNYTTKIPTVSTINYQWRRIGSASWHFQQLIGQYTGLVRTRVGCASHIRPDITCDAGGMLTVLAPNITCDGGQWRHLYTNSPSQRREKLSRFWPLNLATRTSCK